MESIFDNIDNNYIKFGKYVIKIIMDTHNELWFNAVDLALALCYLDTKNAIKYHVDKQDKIQLHKISQYEQYSGQPQSLYLSEAGMYSLVLSSKMPVAKKFKHWVTHDILPSIRKYGSYKLQKQHEKDLNNINQQIKYMEEENQSMKRELLKNNFPNGGVVYAIDYGNDTYRIGKTGNMTSRKKIYDTHLLYNHSVPIISESNCPIKLETCVRSMLYDYRYKNKKDFYICPFFQLSKAFDTCLQSIKCMSQIGGTLCIDKQLKKLKRQRRLLMRKIKLLRDNE